MNQNKTDIVSHLFFLGGGNLSQGQLLAPAALQMLHIDLGIDQECLLALSNCIAAMEQLHAAHYTSDQT